MRTVEQIDAEMVKIWRSHTRNTDWCETANLASEVVTDWDSFYSEIRRKYGLTQTDLDAARSVADLAKVAYQKQ